jgi:hypothetical protein
MSEEENTETTFDNKCNILAELWIDYREDPEFEDFVSYNDIGLPLAFMAAEGLVSLTDTARSLINESYTLLLTSMEIEDTGFDTLDDLMLG